MKLIAIFTLLIFFVSCGGKKATEAKLNISVGKIASANLSGYVDGGGMLYGYLDSGNKFAIDLVAHPDGLTLNLPKGPWKFYGFLWQGGTGDPSGESMKGTIRCANHIQDLQDDKEIISLDFNNANCDTTFAFTKRSDSKFPELQLEVCSDLGSIPNGSSNCAKSGSENQGLFRSIQISFPSYEYFGGGGGNTGEEIFSMCIPFDGADHQVIQSGAIADVANLNIPQKGPSGTPLRTVITTFLDDTCDYSLGFHETVLEDGIYSNDATIHPSGRMKVYHDQTVSAEKFKMYIQLSDTELCSMSPDNTALYIGGVVSMPYGVCNADQFELITSTDMTASYIQLQDIDFSDRMTGFSIPYVSGGSTEPECGAFGSNINPVGGLYSDYPACSTEMAIGSANFSGSYYGNGYKMSNIILMAPDGYAQDGFGIFRNVSGSVSDLTIENSEIEGTGQVGVIAGLSTGTINSIVIKNSFVEAENDIIGGVVGELNNASINSTFILQNVEVRSRGNFTGGAVGKFLGGGTLDRVFFGGEVSADGGGGTPNTSFGGIVGSNCGTCTTRKAFSTGLLHGNLSFTGGIAGGNAGGTVEDSISNMAIYSSNSNSGAQDIGGIVGDNNTGNVDRVFFYGTIKSDCSGTLANCKIGEISDGEGGHTGDYARNMSVASNYGGRGGAPISSGDGPGFDREGDPIDFNSPGAAWTFVAGDYPSLSWIPTLITRECDQTLSNDSVANQIIAGRGSLASNPIYLCHSEHLQEIDANSSYHYKFGDSINASNMGLGDIIINLSGSIDGDGYVLHGISFSNAGAVDAPTGFISDLNAPGEVKNLILANSKVKRTHGSPTVLGTGALVAINNGTIKDIQTIGVDSIGTGGSGDKVGIISGVNNGTITEVSVNYGDFQGINEVGGIAGENTGTISKSASYAYFNNHTSSDINNSDITMIGGIAGNNTGTIEEAYFGSRLDFVHTAGRAGFPYQAGGIAGYNSGDISDVYTEKHAEVNMRQDGNRIGGIVGDNDTGGTIERAYSAMNINTGWCNNNNNGQDYNFHNNKETCNNDSTGTWTIPTGNAGSYNAIAGVNSGTISETFYVTEPFASVGSTMLTGATNNTTYCSLDLGSGSVPSQASATYDIFFQASASGDENHDYYFNISNVTNPGNWFVDIDLDTTDYPYDSVNSVDACGTSGYIVDSSTSYYHIVDPMVDSSAMTGVTRIKNAELAHMDTYCSDGGIPYNDPDFRCISGWDIIEDEEGGDGFNWMIEEFLFEIGIYPENTDKPTWTIRMREDGDERYEYPRLFMDF